VTPTEKTKFRKAAVPVSAVAIIGVLFAGAAFFDLDPPPWLAKAEGVRIAEQQQQTKADVLRLERNYWRQIEQQSERELRAKPASSSARRELDRARDSITIIDQRLNSLTKEKK